MSERFSIDVDGGRIRAIAYSASHPLGITFLMGHGASAGQEDAFIVEYATGLAERGVLVVTYGFPFAEQGGRAPDGNDLLEACCRAAIVGARQCRPKNELFIGGKSLGGRIASHVASDGGDEMADVRGLVILGYPLHPVGKPALRRSHHLARVEVPLLIVQGSRDVLGTPDELRPLVAALPEPSTVYVVDGGDHSFVVPRRESRAQEKVRAAVQDEIVRWMVQVVTTRPSARRPARPRPVAAHRREQLRVLHRRPG